MAMKSVSESLSPKYKPPQLLCVYSLPRSGSTVLISELDKIKGICCLPESYFPQAWSLASRSRDPSQEYLAALYLASSPAGATLSFDEVVKLIDPQDPRASLINIGLKTVEKENRDPNSLKVIVWKTTRIISHMDLLNSSLFKFILLRRNVYNVFESQFRVDFGVHNRNPYRFAAFVASYESVFDKLPCDRTFEIAYDQIPHQIEAVCSWLKIENENWNEGYTSSIARTHGNKEWHSNLLEGFSNRDKKKLEFIEKKQLAAIDNGLKCTKYLKPIFYLLRRYFDKKIFSNVEQDALNLLEREHR